MKRKTTICIVLALVLAICIQSSALSAFTISTGTVVTSPSLDLTIVLPEGMKDVGPSNSYSYGYANDFMLVGLTPLAYSNFEDITENRIGSDFATQVEMTISGFRAREYIPLQDEGIDSIFAIQQNEGANILEIAFYPKDMSATETNQAFIKDVLRGVRSRAQTYESEKDGDGWSILFNHEDTGLQCILPGSMVKCSPVRYSDAVTEYQNDYVTLIIFAYEATLNEYIETYDMNSNDFSITDATENGVDVHVFEPKSSAVSTDCAYVAIEGKNGTLLEIIFGASDSSEETENWMYINQIIANIEFI